MAAWDKVLETANSDVGYIEKASNNQLNDKTANPGKNNYTKYGAYWGHNGPDAYWCDYAVDYWFCKAYGKDIAKQMLGGFSGYTPTSAQYFKNMNRWYTKNPQPGDVIFFENSVRIHHTGIVEKVTSTTVYTIEGNTSNGSVVVANGGMVCKKSYSLNNSAIAGYGRPRWDLVIEEPAYQEGWQVGKNNKWWYQFADGTYAYDNGSNNGWYLINHRWYIFDKDGYMLTGTISRTNLSNGTVETFYLCEDKNGNEGACMRTNERGALEVWYVE